MNEELERLLNDMTLAKNEDCVAKIQTHTSTLQTLNKHITGAIYLAYLPAC